MNAVQIVLLVAGILAVNGVVWTLILASFKRKSKQLMESINASCATTGECLVIGPERGYYNHMKGIASIKTMGVMALTNKRLIFKGPMGMDADITFDQIADISRNVWFQGNYRGGHEFLILKLKDGNEAAFQVPDISKWAEQIQSSVNGEQ